MSNILVDKTSQSLLGPETGNQCRDGEDLEAQPGPDCAQYSQNGTTEIDEGPDRAGQADRHDRSRVKADPSSW